MRKPNFNKVSTELLASYKAEIEEIIKGRKQEEDKKTKLLKKLNSIAESEGMSLDTLLGSSAKKKKTATGKPVRKVAPKYANPKNPAETWTGRGRQPRWVAAYVAKKGTKITDLEI